MKSVRGPPLFHYTPATRLLKSMALNVFPAEPPPLMKEYVFHNVPKEYLRHRELVFDPNVQIPPKGLIFSGDFECGNLGCVWKIAPRIYEINLLPDPSRQYSATWYYFKVDNIAPGEYSFIISGFYRDAQLHNIGVQPVALSMNNVRRGGGWERIGNRLNFWCSKTSRTAPEYSLAFSFNVTARDTMYFAYLYPYSYSDLRSFLMSARINCSSICVSSGGVDVPAIFWDADVHNFVRPISKCFVKKKNYNYKPLVVIAARLHPGESNSSYAMEGFIARLFDGSNNSKSLLNHFSFLLLPMMNPDGVICGYFRPQLTGTDMNRVWRRPDKRQIPEAAAVVGFLDILSQTRPILFLLDFHGHTAQCNAFTYGVRDARTRLNEYEPFFPRIMGRMTTLFDVNESISFHSREYPTTMRVALHHRYSIPFAYTLEMSFGGCNIGERNGTQLTEDSYREVGIATVDAISELLLVAAPIEEITKCYVPPQLF